MGRQDRGIRMTIPRTALFLSAVLAFSIAALAQGDVVPSEDLVPAAKAEYTPFVGDHFPIRPFQKSIS